MLNVQSAVIVILLQSPWK